MADVEPTVQAEPIDDLALADLADRYVHDTVGWRAGAIRLLPQLLARLKQQDDELLSNVSIDGVRQTWRQLAASRDERISRLSYWSVICQDLDRCEHGRHEGDVCDGCGGASHGNPALETEVVDFRCDDFTVPRQIGFTIDGAPIVVPDRAHKSDPAEWHAEVTRSQATPSEGETTMKSELYQRHDVDGLGRPAGGYSEAEGFTIRWQNGPLAVDGERKEPNGAFVEDVIAAAIGRIEHYQESEFHCLENAVALGHLKAAAEVLNERTRDRERRGVEGTHKK